MAYLLTHTNMKKREMGRVKCGGAANSRRPIIQSGAPVFLVLMILFGMFGWYEGSVPAALAAGAGSVVINEIAWAGTADGANDEWIELFNKTDQAVDLTGWTINDDDGSSIYGLSGSIAANGYFLIEDREEAVNTVTAGAVIGLSLANTGDSLVLHDTAANVIDAVNSGGGMWAAGNATSKASMERVSASGSGDDAGNWVTHGGAGGPAAGAAGTAILGTPGGLNSSSAPPVLAQKVSLQLSSATPKVGDVLTVTAKVENVSALFSYGLELDFDPDVLEFVSVGKGSFLSESEGVETSFQSGLAGAAGGVAGGGAGGSGGAGSTQVVIGRLLVAEARTVANKVGVNGAGSLFNATFNVVGGAGAAAGGGGSSGSIAFGTGSFLGGVSADLPSQMTGASFAPLLLQADPVTDLQVVAGTERYSIKLSWKAPAAGVDKYLVYRKDAHGLWKALGEIAALEFVDSDAVTGGGKIIPGIDYYYQVKALKGTVESSAAAGFVKDLRGLKGDNNRTDRVDGRDLEKLARHFAESDSDAGFDALVDTTYDGQINGSDLIDLGVNFAKSY
jgi:hypothetical protein